MMAPQKYYGDVQKQNTYLCKSDKSQTLISHLIAVNSQSALHVILT